MRSGADLAPGKFSQDDSMNDLRHNGKPIIIKYLAFPEELHGHMRGAVSADKDKYYILIDTYPSEEEQRQTLGHELAHIFLDHTDRKMKVAAAEAEAHLWADEYRRRYEAGELGD